MRYRGVVPAVLFCGLSFVWSCAQPASISGSDGTGGLAGQSSGTGGSTTASGDSSASGGSPATGGSPGPAGGVAPTGAGGSSATGGGTATGGKSATGGAPGTGGAPASGGATGSGGASATGGTPASGGTGQGGSLATGGSSGGVGTSTGGRTGHGTGGSSGTSTGGSSGTPTGGGSGTSTGGSSGSSTGGGPGQGSGGSVVTPTGGTGGSSSTGGGGSGSTSSTAAGTIVPLYTDPSDSSWDAIITAAVAHPTVHVVAIVNPSDGPGSSKDSGYTSGIAALQAAHIEVIGYVATGYGSHSIASMESEIDQWKAFYPTLQGIFFDEQSNSTSDVAHYQTLSQYAKSVGLDHTVGNPGTDVPAAYVGAIDTMLIYESNGVPSISSLSQWSGYAPSNFGVIPYAVSAMNTTFVQQARQYVEYIYLTNDDLPNPWDSLTSYFSDLLAALE
jgi:Spherulation-specific family 4